MQYLDKHGWPVERVKGRWVFNLLRLTIHTRKIKTGRFEYKPIRDNACDCDTEIKELVLLQDPICGKHHG